MRSAGAASTPCFLRAAAGTNSSQASMTLRTQVIPSATAVGWIGYLIAGFIGACIQIAIVRAFSGGLQQRT
jgi:uncharacterized membrane protein YeaQ/YmgE (transglycosylase-associated protein family)